MAIRRRYLAIGAGLCVLVAALVIGRRALRGADGPHGSGAASDPGGAAAASGDDPWSHTPSAVHHIGAGADDPSAIKIGPALVEGTVRDAATHAPVAGAQVGFWNRRGEQTTQSGSDGHYRIEITVGAWSYGASDGTDRISTPHSIEVAAQNPPVDIEVEQVAHVHGVVRDAAGRPVSGAEVTYDHADKAVREAFDATIGRIAQSGGDGSYRLAVLPGAVGLRATAQHKLGHRVVPGIARGADVQADLTVLDQVTVDGRVVDESGKAVAGVPVTAYVAITDIGYDVKRVSPTGADGRFRFDNLNPGWLTINARSDDGGMTRNRDMIELVHGDLHDLELVMIHPAPVRGHVTYDDGSPAVGAHVKVTRVWHGGVWAETTTGAGGTFEVRGPADGEFDALATVDGASGRAQGITPDKPGEIVIRAPGGIRGTVRAGKAPATEFTVAIDRFVPSGGSRAVGAPSQHRFVVADGTYELAHLDPGSYDLTVHADGAAASQLHAVVNGAAWTDLDVALAAAGAVTGRVHAGARAIANARIDVHCTGGSAVSGGDGKFQLVDLPATDCPITVHADGFASVDRTVKPGAPVDVALDASAH
jgi:protocatechuate 3,4-dioxygenase beta subunit